MLSAVAADPAKMQALASERVRVAIVSSSDQTAAVGMMLRSDAAIDPAAIVEDVRLVSAGKVRPLLLWEKHPIVIVGGILAILVLLLLLRRLLFPRRRQPAAT